MIVSDYPVNNIETYHLSICQEQVMSPTDEDNSYVFLETNIQPQGFACRQLDPVTIFYATRWQVPITAG